MGGKKPPPTRKGLAETDKTDKICSGMGGNVSDKSPVGIHGCLVQSFGAWKATVAKPWLLGQIPLRRGLQWIPISNIYLRSPYILVSIMLYVFTGEDSFPLI